MKTNHRRKRIASPVIPKGLHEKWGKELDYLINEDGGPRYGPLMSIALMRHGCGPNYTTRTGAVAAIRGRKKKDHRAERHAADRAVQREADTYDRDVD